MASPAQAFPFAGFPVHPAHDPMGLGKSIFNLFFFGEKEIQIRHIHTCIFLGLLLSISVKSSI